MPWLCAQFVQPILFATPQPAYSCGLLSSNQLPVSRLCRAGSRPAAAAIRAANRAPQQPVGAAPSSGGSAPASKQRLRHPAAQPLWLERQLASAWQLWALLSGGASGGRKRRLLRRKRLVLQRSLACWSPYCHTQSCTRLQMPAGLTKTRQQAQQAAARPFVEAKNLPASPPAQPSSSRRAAAGGQRATSGQRPHPQFQLSLLPVPSGSAPHPGRQQRQQQLER